MKRPSVTCELKPLTTHSYENSTKNIFLLSIGRNSRVQCSLSTVKHSLPWWSIR